MLTKVVPLFGLWLVAAAAEVYNVGILYWNYPNETVASNTVAAVTQLVSKRLADNAHWPARHELK